MKRALILAACASTFASASWAEGEVALAKLFSSACAKHFPSYSGTSAVATKAGLAAQKDGTFKGDGYLLNPNVKLSSKGKACLLMRHGADPEVTAKALVSTLKSAGVKISKATRKGRRATFEVSVGGSPATIFVAPVHRTFTSVSISKG